MSLHADTVAVLRTYAPEGPEQLALRTTYLDHVLGQDHPLSREGVPDHVTASALVASPTGEHVLLALHRRAGRWFQTGGHIEDGDDSLAAAALREATEESGLSDLVLADGGPVRLDLHPAPCTTPGARHHLDVQYVAVSRSVAEPVVSEESLDVQWFGWDALPAGADESVVALVAAARRRLRSR